MSRDKDKPASLNELLGKAGDQQISLKDLPNILGEKLPDMPRNRIGKYRLLNALRVRFGPGFKNIPGVKNILSEFDAETQTENVIKQNLEARNG